MDGEDDTRPKGKNAQSSSSTSGEDPFLALKLSADTDSTFKKVTNELEATNTEHTHSDAAEVEVDSVELEAQTFEENENDWNAEAAVWQLQAGEKGYDR